MSLRKLILLVIFLCGAADSKQPGGFKIQMKDGNFFIDDGSGDVAVEVLDKGPDLSCLQDSSVKSNGSSLINTLNLLDKTISDLGIDSDKKKAFSDLDISNQREQISQLRRLLGESNLVETLRGDENDFKSVPTDLARSADANIGPTNKKQVSKISDADLQKLREVLDREYGKSILLIPKLDLESFIHFVKEYSLNDLLRSSDISEFNNANDRVRLRTPPNATNIPSNLNRFLSSQPQTKFSKQIASDENRQQIMQQVARFLDGVHDQKESVLQDPLRQNGFNSYRDPNVQMTFSSSDDRNSIKNVLRQEPVSLELVKDFLENLSEDKTQLKQSLLRWFEKNSESDSSQQRHFNFRRSLKKSSTTSSPSKKDKKSRKNQQKEKTIFQRISRGEYPNYRKHRRMPINQALADIDSSQDDQLRDKRDLISSGEHKLNGDIVEHQEREVESEVPEERRTRADLIR